MQHTRRSLIKTTGALAAAGAFVPSLAANSDAVAQDDTPFIIASLEEPGSLSALVNLPHHFPLDVPQTLLFDSLTQFLPDSTIGPKLATSWTVSDDNLIYTFSLDPEARFHDGEPVTAEDVKFTFDAILDPASNASTEGLETVESVEVIDAQTVAVTLSEITPMFLSQGGARGIVPRHLLEGKDLATDDFNRNPVGCGPYRLASYTPGEAIVFESVSDHYRASPGIGTIVFRIVTDQNVILTQLRTGEVSYALVAPRDLTTVDQFESVTVVEAETPRFFDISPNHERPYWRDQAVRSAILQGIDRASIVEKILAGHGVVVEANVTPASWAFTTEGITSHPYDPEAAAAALDAAGWTRDGDGTRQKDGEELAFSVMLYNYDRTLQQAMLVAQQNLGDIGVSMEVESVEPGVYGDRRSSGEFDALARVWNPVYDPDQASLLSTGNFYGYSNPDVDALSAEGRSVIDQEQRKPIYAELQQVLSADLPRLFLYSENELHAVTTSLTGLAPHPVNVFWNLETWTFGG